MTLFSITLNNIKKNFKNYGAYFLSSSFSVFVVYLFIAILSSKNIQDELGDMKKFIIVFNIGSVMIVFFSAFFIWYSNAFFIKARKKEFATYMLLGMSKKQVAKLSFYENFIIMILSLLTGIIFGLIFTKFFIMLLFFMIKTSSSVPFQWNTKALEVSILVFLIIFAVINLHGSILVRKSNLIDLFNASKKIERGLKVSFITFILSIVAVICLAYGYYVAVKKLGSNLYMAPKVVLMVVLGTILFFTSLTSLIIYLNKKNEKSLFKGTKLISTAQLYQRYKGNAGTLSIIAITTTIALCALVTCVGSYSKTADNSRYMRPFSIEYFNTNNADKIFQSTLSKHNEVSVKYRDNIELLKTKAIDPLRNQPWDFYIISQSEFDKINNHQGVNRKAGLANEKDCYFVQIQDFVTDKSALGKKAAVNIGKQSYEFNVTGTDIKPYVALDHFNETLVVKDNIFNEMKASVDKSDIVNITGWTLKNDFKAESFTADLAHSLNKENNLLTFYEHYKSGLKLLGMMAFIGLFIGLLFVTAAGSIIYFKMSMEAKEDKSKFITMSKIGVSKKEIKRAVSKELLLFFGVPLLIAAANTYPATLALSDMLQFKLIKIYMVILLVYAAVYCIYYFATLNSYMKTVTE
ncbi:MAG: ABC transporter permease [Bacillota bacterium]|nr:ABC transporter permease [Bacillota bacterium]